MNRGLQIAVKQCVTCRYDALHRAPNGTRVHRMVGLPKIDFSRKFGRVTLPSNLLATEFDVPYTFGGGSSGSHGRCPVANGTKIHRTAGLPKMDFSRKFGLVT